MSEWHESEDNVRKLPKYRPIKPEMRQTGKRDIVMGFMAVILIITLMAGGVVALAMTGLFTPISIDNPLIEEPEDRLSIKTVPTKDAAAGLLTYTVASSSGKITALTDEQRKQLQEQITNENYELYWKMLEDPDSTEALLDEIRDLPKLTVSKVDLHPNKNLPSDWYNVLLLGTDDRDSDSTNGRTDVIIVASFNVTTGEIKLSSFARDILLDLPKMGQARINTLHVSGGANMVMQTLNDLFELNIEDYVLVNLHGLVKVIELFGGVYIDLQPGEAEQINYNVAVSEDYEGFEKNPDRVPIKAGTTGITKLDPLQALGYARIRHLDNDFARNNRQKVLLEKLMEMILADPSVSSVFRWANPIMSMMSSTNLKLNSIMKIVAQSLANGIQPMQSYSVPYEGSFQYAQHNGESVLQINLSKNKVALHEFIYGQYIPAN